MRVVRSWALVALEFGICACGGRTGLDPEPAEDLAVSMECPPSPQFIAVDQTMSFEADVDPMGELVEGLWRVNGDAPVSLKNAGTRGVSLSANEPTSFTVIYEGVFSDGSRHSCQTSVEAVAGISARCPESPLVAFVDTPLQVIGHVFDSVAVEDAGWRLFDSEADWITITETTLDNGAASAEVVASRKGMARLELFARNARGEVDWCSVDVLIPEPLSASCAPEVRAAVDEPVELQVRLEGGGPFESHELIATSRDGEIPEASWGNFQLQESLATVDFTALEAGTFKVQHKMGDAYGQVATCDTNVVAEPGAPTVQCPPVIETEPLTRVSVRARVSDDEGKPDLEWELVSKPPGSDASSPFPVDAEETSFRPDLAGEYTLRLIATDSDGLSGFCETHVLAIATEGLRVEMFWDTDRTDMDLHVLSPEADAWFTSLDCHFANCTSGLEWGEHTTDDDPRLDIDDTNGFGPENINIDVPEPASYEIGVHAFQGRSQTNAVTVRIYCGGSTTEPKRTLGPVNLRGATSPFNNDFWKAARVSIDDQGDCEITAFSGDHGGPIIVTGTAASLAR